MSGGRKRRFVCPAGGRGTLREAKRLFNSGGMGATRLDYNQDTKKQRQPEGVSISVKKFCKVG